MNTQDKIFHIFQNHAIFAYYKSNIIKQPKKNKQLFRLIENSYKPTFTLTDQIP